NRATVDLFRDLLELRRTDPIFAAQDASRLHGAVLDPRAFVLRFGTGSGDDRIVLVNFGTDLDVGGKAEPLLAPPSGCDWNLILSTEDPKYGGGGTPPLGPRGELRLPGGCTLVFA